MIVFDRRQAKEYGLVDEVLGRIGGLEKKGFSPPVRPRPTAPSC